MPKYGYTATYTDYLDGIVDANNEADAEYQIEMDYTGYEDLVITRLEEVVE